MYDIQFFFMCIVFLLFGIFTRKKGDTNFLIGKTYGIIFLGFGLVINLIAISFLGIGKWFLLLSIPFTLFLTIWIYFIDKKSK